MKKFKASGILYSNGEHIGLTKCRIDGEDLEGVVKRSPEKIPVVSSFEHWRNPENVIGHATLEYVRHKGNPHIDAHVTFNTAESDFYEALLKKDRKAVRLGFMIRQFTRDENDILHDGRINLIVLSPDALGGYIYNFGWEDDDASDS